MASIERRIIASDGPFRIESLPNGSAKLTVESRAADVHGNDNGNLKHAEFDVPDPRAFGKLVSKFNRALPRKQVKARKPRAPRPAPEAPAALPLLDQDVRDH